MALYHKVNGRLVEVNAYKSLADKIEDLIDSKYLTRDEANDTSEEEIERLHKRWEKEQLS